MQNTHWWNNAVVYQIYPKSYQDSNGDGEGDLRGIISRLDYLHELGVDILWLSPIYKSPQIDNGYDISDYQSINPDFGTLNDFDELVEKAHSLNIKIMMDLVVNHTSDQHEWFQQAKQGKDNAYRDYYIWRAGRDGDVPNNWASLFGGSAWQFDDASQQYYLHLYAPQQPDLNWENPHVRHSVYDMMNWWVARGVDGFRMDVISQISKPADFPDAKKNHDALFADAEPLIDNRPRVHDFLKEMNCEVMSKHPLVTVGETLGATVTEAVKYADLHNTELNMVFEFEHMALDSNPNSTLGRWYDGKARLTDLRANLTKWQEGLAGKAWNSLYWNNHDQPRVVSRFGDDSSEEYRVLSAKMLATMLHLLQGTPYIYQGEEIGMTNAGFTELSDYNDIDSTNTYHQFVDEQHLLDPQDDDTRYIAAHSRDNARTPMQWNDSENAGFTTGKPWLRLNPAYPQINVEKALADKKSIFYYYKKLIELRHSLPVITNGTYALVEGNADDPDVYTYTRRDDDTTLLVILNFTKKHLSRHYEHPDDAERIISNYSDDAGDTLRPYEAKVYQF